MLHKHDEAMKIHHHHPIDSHTVVKKRKLMALELQLDSFCQKWMDTGLLNIPTSTGTEYFTPSGPSTFLRTVFTGVRRKWLVDNKIIERGPTCLGIIILNKD